MQHCYELGLTASECLGVAASSNGGAGAFLLFFALAAIAAVALLRR